MSSSVSSGAESRGGISVEQLIGECFVKAANVILSSRIYEPGSPSQGSQRRNTWFKLELKETVESARPLLARYRRERGVGLPLVLEIRLQPWETSTAQRPPENQPSQSTQGTLLERWIVHYRPLTALPAILTPTQISRLSQEGIYKRLVLLLRSLYSLCRTLPAYRLYRMQRSQPGHAAFRLAYNLHSTLPASSTTAHNAGKKMQRTDFGPVDTAEGSVHLSVEHQPASAVKILGQAAVKLSRPSIITDYIRGGERIAPSGPHTRGARTSKEQISPLQTAPSAPGSIDSKSEDDVAAGPSQTPRWRTWSSSGNVRFSPGRSPSPGTSPRFPGLTLAHASNPILPTSMAPSPASSPQMTSYVSKRSSSAQPWRPASLGKPPLPPPMRPLTRVDSSGGHDGDIDDEEEEEGGEGKQRKRDSVPPMAAALQPPYAAVSQNTAQGEEEEEEEEGEEGCSSRGQVVRKASAPMMIPGSKHAPGYARPSRPLGLRSSGDLGALVHAMPQTANREERPSLSAPAAPNVLLSRGRNRADAGVPAAGHSSPQALTVAEDYGDAWQGTVAGSLGHRQRCADGDEIGPLPCASSSRPQLPPTPLRMTAVATAAATASSAGGVVGVGTADNDGGVLIRGNIAVESRGIGVERPSLTSMSFSDSASEHSPAEPFPASCSPDLPFAFTPQARYTLSSPRVNSLSLSRQASAALGQSTSPRDLATSAGSSSSSSALLPRGEASGSTALVRRSSWALRSGTPSVAEGSLTLGMGYSVSPLHDHTFESLLTSASASFPGARSFPPPCTVTQRVPPSTFQTTTAAQATQGSSGLVPLLTLEPHPGDDVSGDEATKPPATASLEADANTPSSRTERSTTVNDALDSLPFAAVLGPETSGSLAHDGPWPYGAVAASGMGEEGMQGTREAAAGLAISLSAPAVGAFVRQIREARPIHVGTAPMELQAGLAQLERLSASLRRYGIE